MNKGRYIKVLAKILCSFLFPCLVFADVWEPVASGVNGNDTALTPKKFARELFADGSVRISPGFATYNLGTNLTVSTVAIFTIDGGTWGTALSNSSLTLDDVDGSGSSAVITLIEGGGFDDNSASFRIDVNTQLTTGDEFTLNYDLDDTVTLEGPQSITLGIILKDKFGKISEDDDPGVVAESVEAVLVSDSIAGFSGGIDFLNELITFSDTVDPLEIKLLEFSITDGVAVSDGVEDDGVTTFDLQSGDAAVKDARIDISGSFGSSLSVDQDGESATNDGLSIRGCVERSASSLTESFATFNFSGSDVLTMKNGGVCSLIMRVDGVSMIEEFSGKLLFSLDYKNPAYIDELVSIPLYEVAINSSNTQFLDLLLPTASGFSHLVRISNLGINRDKIYATLYNDLGHFVFFELLNGQLGPSSSTKMIPVEEIYDTAVAKDPSFTAEGGKLRLRLNSEIPISARSYTISTDQTTFTSI